MTRLCRAKEKILCSCECAKNTFNDTGDNGEGETPVPIPNTAVKPFCAESTELDTTWEGRTLPVTKREDSQNGCLFSFGNLTNKTADKRRISLSRLRFSCSCTSSTLAAIKPHAPRSARFSAVFSERNNKIIKKLTPPLDKTCTKLKVAKGVQKRLIFTLPPTTSTRSHRLALSQPVRRKCAPVCAVFSGSQLPI